MSAPLILASASPRRLELLAQIGITPNLVLPADINEDPYKDEKPLDYVERMGYGKAKVIADDHPGHFIIGADTAVICGHQILPKAEDIDTAHACIKKLSGRRHRVYGGLCIFAPNGKAIKKTVQSLVQFKRLSQNEIDAYLASKEWDGKAGGYAIQGLAAAYIKQISGSYTNIVGLPLFETKQILTGLGYGCTRTNSCRED